MIFHLLLSVGKMYRWTKMRGGTYPSFSHRIRSQPKACPLVGIKSLSSNFKDMHRDLESST